MYQKMSKRAAILCILALSACAHVSVERGTVISKVENESYELSKGLSNFSDFILIKTNAENGKPQQVSLENMLDDLAGYDVVFAGEAHGHAANHLLQLKVLSGLYERNHKIALSMEQFERDTQKRLDEYLAGEIGEAALTENGVGWSHYKQSYRPMVEFAKYNKLSVIAANAPGKAVRCIGMQGPKFLESVKGEKRTWLAQSLNLHDGAYKDKYYNFMGAGMGHGSSAKMSAAQKEKKLFNSFAAQVVRDDTMAESIFGYLKKNPDYKVVHTNGNFHSAALLGTVERLALRNPALKLANIHPVLIDDLEHPRFTDDDLSQGQYLVLISALPQQYVKKENMMKFFARTGKKMKTRVCEY